MSGFTTTATISELIDKRPINRKRRVKITLKAPQNRKLRASQRLLKVRGT
tara:strand:- start:1439 stop:1588 length:150 start_codon:yes stop_codon:yes gene_type:complete